MPKAPLKNAAQYKYVGKSLRRPDLPAKMTGRHTFVHDFKLPNMLHARVIRPTSIGATLAEVDDSSIANIPGARVVRIQNFLAVVAENEWNAVRAARALARPLDRRRQSARFGQRPRRDAQHSARAE